MAHLIKLQASGQEGVLLTKNGRANIFYLLGRRGRTWEVYCAWDEQNQWWLVEAAAVPFASSPRAGVRVFSPAALVGS